MTRPLAVLKFGSSVLTDESALPVAVDEIREHVEDGQSVLAVVSALGGGTDELIAQARRLAPDPDPAALAALLATGESTATALLGVALQAGGLPATVLDPGRVGPLTHGPLLDGRPYEMNRTDIRRALEARPVAVLPGFIGRTDDGRTSLLGRGGSDLSALFAAHVLDAAECRLLKDVDGIYENDPRGKRSRPRRYVTLSLRDAVDLGDVVVQPKAARFALRHRVTFEVGAPGGPPGTRVGPMATVLDTAGNAGSPSANSGSLPSGPASSAAAAIQQEGSSWA